VGLRRSWLPAILFCALAAGFGPAALANDRSQPAPTDTATPAAVPSDMPSAVPTSVPSAMPPGTMTPMATPKPGAALFDGNWHTTLVPYIWAPNINGTLKFALPNSATTVAKYVNIKAGPNDYLSSLNFAIMVTAEVRKGNWSLLGDYINLNLSTTTGSVASISGPHGNLQIPTTLNTASRLTGTLWLLAPNYTLAHGSAGSVDILAGVRALDSTASATWAFTAGKNDFISRSGSVSQGVSLTDFVGGVRGTVYLGTARWYVPYYADFGWGNNNSTWRGQIAIAMAAKHGQAIFLGYRTIQYNMTNNNVLQTVRFSGPGIGYGFQI
jgi:hypothetical protein